MRRANRPAGPPSIPRRHAERSLAICPSEKQAFGGQSVHVRRSDNAMPVAAEDRVQVVHGDKQDVRPNVLRRPSAVVREQQARDEKDAEL